MNETLALTRQDVDLKNGTITFHRPPPATGRTIPISPPTCGEAYENMPTPSPYAMMLNRSSLGETENPFGLSI